MTTSVSTPVRGRDYARFITSLARSKGDLCSAAREAASSWGVSSAPAVLLSRAADVGGSSFEQWRKSAVDAGGTASTSWSASLATAGQMQADLLAAVAARSILGRLDRVRRVPAFLPAPRADGVTSADWLAEGQPIPCRVTTADSVILSPRKVGGLLVLSVELVKHSDSRAEALVRQALINAASRLADGKLLSSDAAVSGVSPAGLGFGVTPLQSSGNVLTDIEEMINAYSGDLDSAVILTDKLTAVQIGLRNSGNANIVVGARGGEAVGIPVLVSDSSPRSSSGGQLLLLDQAQLMVSDEGIDVDASQEAAVQMDDAPGAGPQTLTSLWQNGLVGMRLIRFLDWAPPVAGAVALVVNASY
jgi:HK97 family phage major capsid protein